MWDALALLLSLTALYFGAEWLVRGASRLAASLGVRPLVIGLTVVGFGTSMPEVVVSALASARGNSSTALGNVLGSNIANPGLILSVAAFISPMKSDLGLLRREGPILLGVTLIVWGAAWTGGYERWMGLTMLAGLILFISLSLRWSRDEPAEIEAEFEEFESRQKLLRREQTGRQVALIVLGLATLVLGGHLLISSAVSLARQFGIPELVIAATRVAVGTSLPELATSIIAALRRQPDISVGNIVGSNVFNLLGVLGLSAALRPIPVPASVRDFEFLWMLGFTAAAILILRTGHRISRVEGALLLTGYCAFIFVLLLR